MFETGSFIRLSNHVARTVRFVDWRHVDADLTTHQTFGSELIVGERQDRAHAELAVELVERWRAEARSDTAPRRNFLADVVEQPPRGD